MKKILLITIPTILTLLLLLQNINTQFHDAKPNGENLNMNDFKDQGAQGGQQGGEGGEEGGFGEEPYEDEDDQHDEVDIMEDLVPTTILQTLEKNSCYLIHFVENNCNVCNDLHLILRDTSLAAMDDGVRCKFFRYNLSDDKSGVIDRKKWDIKEIPTLVLSVRKDGKDNKKVFFGLRDSEVMLKFIKIVNS